jgi:hypothetical protein
VWRRSDEGGDVGELTSGLYPVYRSIWVVELIIICRPHLMKHTVIMRRLYCNIDYVVFRLCFRDIIHSRYASHRHSWNLADRYSDDLKRYLE